MLTAVTRQYPDDSILFEGKSPDGFKYIVVREGNGSTKILCGVFGQVVVPDNLLENVIEALRKVQARLAAK